MQVHTLSGSTAPMECPTMKRAVAFVVDRIHRIEADANAAWQVTSVASSAEASSEKCVTKTSSLTWLWVR